MQRSYPDPIELDRVGSTQDELRRLAAEGAPALTAVRAEEQTAGRGRRGRTWSAPHGSSLLVSILLRPSRAPEELAALSLVGGIAVCEAVRTTGVEARLRWPNDVVAGPRKLAGVLPELVDGPAVLLGVGVNVSLREQDLPPTDRLPATSLLLEGAEVPAPGELLRRLLAALVPLLEQFDARGFAPLAPLASALDPLSGEPLTLSLADGSERHGVGAGIDRDGALLLRTADGVERHVSGEVVRVR
jgi:BirA family biotin operon repressor/biotin-[acetyl-CoA-carboxylase] ligase